MSHRCDSFVYVFELQGFFLRPQTRCYAAYGYDYTCGSTPSRPAAVQPPTPSLPCVVIAKGEKPSNPRLSPLPIDDAHLDLRILNLRHRNHTFPHRAYIFNLVTRICDSLAPFHSDSYMLQ